MNYLILALVPLIVVFVYLVSRPRRVPKFVMEFANLVNLALDEREREIFKFSIFFKQHPQAQVLYLFTGKNEGKETYFGSFFENKKIYYFVMRKEQTSPLVITDTSERFDLTNSMTIEKPAKWLIYSKEKYLIESAAKSLDFLHALKSIFVGQNNWLEFTDLNQAFLITDYQFSNSNSLVQWLAEFAHLKRKM